jgi:F-type H+-transporting ATPase subunit delta
MPQIDYKPPRQDTVLDVTAEQIARVYAKALLAAAAQSPDVAGLVDEFHSLVQDVLQPFPALEQALRSSLVSLEQKERLLDRVFAGRASETVLNFLKVVARHGRLELLRPIARQLRKLYAKELGQADVEIRTAAALDASLEREIGDQLRATLGAEPILRVFVDPALVAGMIIRVGDRVFDSSVATQLHLLRRAMIDRATERIETQPERFLTSSAR